MKKILVVSLMVAVLLVASVGAVAASSGFVSSPSGGSAPELVQGKNVSEDCEAILEITPYSERNDLPETLRVKMEAAYEQIIAAVNLDEMSPKLAEIAKNMNINAEDLAVSDLFDIYYTDCVEHDAHGQFDIVLKADALKRFVALLHLKGDTWELVENAEVKEVNGELHLYFSVEDFSPFAVVVNASGTPATGESIMIYVSVAVMIVSAAVIVFVVVKSRKKKA